MSRNHLSSQRASRATILAGYVALLIAVQLATAASIDNFPSIDFDSLGAVSIAGAFAGIQIWNQTGSLTNPNNTYDAEASSLLSRAANGTLTQISATEEGGTINAICQMQSSPHLVFVAGNYRSIGGTEVSNIAVYNPSTNRFDNLAGGLDGTVNTVYCDDQNQKLIAGGAFTHPTEDSSSRYLGSVASWDIATSSWSPLDFGGLDGSVNTITPGANSSLVRFGGDFSTIFATPGVNGSQSGTNTSASALTSALTPLSLGQVEFVGGPSSSNTGYNNPAQILCPQGADGSGNSYLFQDGIEGRLTARAFRALDVRAIRLGNTFVDGRGTQTFGIVSIPDNTELELIYLDPTTNLNVTCTNNCTLFHDPSVPYQDFLIADTAANNAPGGVKTLTGIQFTATGWYGAGAGLHVLELLSVGGWAYAYDALNRGGCESSQSGVNGTTSSSTNQGGWYPSTIVSLAGTTEPVLALTDSYSNLQSVSSASVTWNVDIAYNGNYTINIFVPGCASSAQCTERTDVNVNVFAVEGSPGSLTRVSQTNEQDKTVQIYSGEVNKAADGFQPTVILSIPTDAPAPSGGNQFTVIADRISFVLRDSNETLQISRSTGFGLLEYNVYDNAIATIQNNGTGALPNTVMTNVDVFSTTLYKNGVRGNASASVLAISSVSGSTFVAGAFTPSGGVSFHNIAGFSADNNGSDLISIANGGLNGAVRALATLNDELYAVGEFTSTADESVALRYVARYDPSSNVWSALANGPDGPISSIHAVASDALLVSGSFETVNGTGQTGGYAVWNTSTNAWQPQTAFLSADISAAYAKPDSSSGLSFLAGSVKAISMQSASGAAQLEAPATDGGLPVVESLNFQFASATGSASSAQSSSRSARRRRVSNQSEHQQLLQPRPRDQTSAASLTDRLRSLLSRRIERQPVAQPLSLQKRADAMQPSSLSSHNEHEILASAFWHRSDGSYINILGGNFSTTAGIRNLAFYDDSTDQLTAFPTMTTTSGQDSNSAVRALFVDSDMLYVGGDNGFNIYDLKKGAWTGSGAALSSASGQVLSVTSISHRPSTTTVVVSGSFASAGSLPCLNVCLWDTSALRWSPLSAGMSGQISAVDFAGSKASQLILAGSMTINGAEASLASYNFDTQIWSSFGSVGTASGQISGPATAVSVNNLNTNAIFVAGRTSDGTAPYFVKWNGSQFDPMADGDFLADTGISQLTFVPLSEPHTANSVLENNRLLVISGALMTEDYGNVSSVFFDGQSIIPFLLATNTDGSTGIVRAFSRSTEVLTFKNLHRLAVGLVILISIAIGLGIVFLLVLLSLLWALARRRPERHVTVPISDSEDSLGLGEKKRPSSLLATLNAATETAMLGGVGLGAAAAAGRRDTRPDSGQDYSTGEQDYRHSQDASGSQYNDQEGYYGAAAAAGDDEDESASMEGIPAHARYDFVPNHDSELPLTAGEPIVILDDQDKHWWLARNDQGRTGVVPSSYVM